MAVQSPSTVAIVGAGIIGLCSAIELRAANVNVILIDPDEPGGPHAASYGNAACISSGAVIPISLPGMWRKVPGYLLDKNGPLTIRWSHLLPILPWLIRFMKAGWTWGRVRACASSLYPLCRNTVRDHQAYAITIGQPDLVDPSGGLVYLFKTRADYESSAKIWSIRRELGVQVTEIEPAELRRLQPQISDAYGFACRIDSAGHVRDPGVYCQAILAHLQQQGVRYVKARAESFAFDGGQVSAVVTDQGSVACDGVVLAAGIDSASLARQLGDSIPLIAERGYHVVLPDLGFDLSAAYMPTDGQMAVVSTASGIRVAGQVELASPRAAPDWRRADILIRYAQKMFSQYQNQIDRTSVARWIGNRPSTPDGLPVIGQAARSAAIVYAFGHGHAGLTQAPATAKLVRALLTGEILPFDDKPYRAKRF